MIMKGNYNKQRFPLIIKATVDLQLSLCTVGLFGCLGHDLHTNWPARAHLEIRVDIPLDQEEQMVSKQGCWMPRSSGHSRHVNSKWQVEIRCHRSRPWDATLRQKQRKFGGCPAWNSDSASFKLGVRTRRLINLAGGDHQGMSRVWTKRGINLFFHSRPRSREMELDVAMTRKVCVWVEIQQHRRSADWWLLVRRQLTHTLTQTLTCPGHQHQRSIHSAVVLTLWNRS